MTIEDLSATNNENLEKINKLGKFNLKKKYKNNKFKIFFITVNI